MPDTEAVQQDQWLDVKPLLDQELSRLPDIYRTVVVLCDLEGRTRKEVAGQLGVPEGTVAGRLARARAMLAKRLTERGVTLSGGVLAAVLSRNVACGGVPDSVVSSAIKTASLLAAGQAAAGGAISVKVAALTEGVMKAMLFTKLRAALAVVLILGFVATGATMLTCRTAAGQDDRKPAAEKPVEPAAKQEKEKEAFTAWGTEADGLQAGLGYQPGHKRAYSYGETVPLVVRVRNVSKKEIRLNYMSAFFFDWPPSVTDDKGNAVPPLRVAGKGGEHNPVQVNLAPGKEIELAEVKLELIHNGGMRARQEALLHNPGKYQIQYEHVMYSSGKYDIDPILGRLPTGKLELEIKSDPPAAAESNKGITIRVVIEKVNADSRAITASCVALGIIDGERKPLRLENLSVSKFAKVRINGKERALADLKAGTEASLELDGRESTLTVVGIEVPGDHPPAGVPEGAPNKK
jgi:hypothetical protein